MTQFKKLVTALFAVLLLLSAALLATSHANKGMLRIVTKPGDAQILIDGKLKGNAAAEAGQSFTIKLDEGEHQVQAVKAKGELYEYYGEKNVFVAEDSLQTIVIDLKSRLTEKARQANGPVAKVIVGVELSMITLPAGSFTMGSPIYEAQYSLNERPQHTVNVPAFEMAKHELTFDEWDACEVDGGCVYRPEDMGWGRGSRPVINVSWVDAQQYISWLNKKTGERYRLPSEAEWEYAARAGTTTRFNTGGCITTSQANFDGSSNYLAYCPKGKSSNQTVPVGSLPANSWGLFGMHGNVFEWTQDCYHAYSDTLGDGSARVDGDCSLRMFRGGSFNESGNSIRSAYRASAEPDQKGSNVGFRLARSR